MESLRLHAFRRVVGFPTISPYCRTTRRGPLTHHPGYDPSAMTANRSRMRKAMSLFWLGGHKDPARRGRSSHRTNRESSHLLAVDWATHTGAMRLYRLDAPARPPNGGPMRAQTQNNRHHPRVCSPISPRRVLIVSTSVHKADEPQRDNCPGTVSHPVPRPIHSRRSNSRSNRAHQQTEPLYRAHRSSLPQRSAVGYIAHASRQASAEVMRLPS